jgi:hypothetical protein
VQAKAEVIPRRNSVRPRGLLAQASSGLSLRSCSRSASPRYVHRQLFSRNEEGDPWVALARSLSMRRFSSASTSPRGLGSPRTHPCRASARTETELARRHEPLRETTCGRDGYPAWWYLSARDHRRLRRDVQEDRGEIGVRRSKHGAKFRTWIFDAIIRRSRHDGRWAAPLLSRRHARAVDGGAGRAARNRGRGDRPATRRLKTLRIVIRLSRRWDTFGERQCLWAG